MMLAEVARHTSGVPDVVCTILLLAVVIAFILGLAEAIGVATWTWGRNRFGTLLVAVILLVVYLVVC